MKLVKNTLLPMAGIVILLYLGQYIYMVDDQIEWMRLMLVVGVPFGIPYMLFVIPIGGDPATSVFLIMLNILIGALFGCVIAVFAVIRAVVYGIGWIIGMIIRAVKKIRLHNVY